MELRSVILRYIGEVMGSKKLSAIAVRGKKKIQFADKDMLNGIDK